MCRICVVHGPLFRCMFFHSSVADHYRCCLSVTVLQTIIISSSKYTDLVYSTVRMLLLAYAYTDRMYVSLRTVCVPLYLHIFTRVCVSRSLYFRNLQTNCADRRCDPSRFPFWMEACDQSVQGILGSFHFLPS